MIAYRPRSQRGRLVRNLTVLAIFIALAVALYRCQANDCTAGGGHLQPTYRAWTCIPNPTPTGANP